MKRERYFEAQEFENIKEILYHSVEKYGENTAYILKHKKDKKIEYEKITYQKLLEDINSFGTKLFELGYQNKRIAIVGRNRYEWVIAHLTNLLGGMVSVPLDKELQVDELESCLERSKAEVLIFDEKYTSNIEEIKKRNNTNLQEYICMSPKETYLDVATLVQEGKELMATGNKEYIHTKIDSYKMNILLFTSGTTSKSKAVALSQNNIASNVYAMQLVEKFYPTDVNLAFLPSHHIFGSTAIIVMLACGVQTAFPDGLRYVAQNLKEYKVSVFVGVPLLVEAIYKKVEQGIAKQGKTKVVALAKKISNLLLKFHMDIRRKLFKSILDELGGYMRFVISGGAPLDKRVAKGFNEMGIKLVQGYGLTETSPVIAAENEKKVKYGSIGVPMENVEVEFENKDENGIGELKVKGPNVMLGYYENPEATKEVLKDGWFYTGDLGYQDKEGYLFITGRKKDMIVLKNGKKVFPEELEILINRLDEVEECMVFGMPDKSDKNDVKISVKIVYDKEYVKEKYPDIDQKELEKMIWQKIKEINKTFPPYKYIKNMILTDQELIKTTTKKIKRNEEIRQLRQD
ncbi:MAG: AMP-binding protein [Clostridia bacterium]|nr:AMP-binding protein [Clostridia bacterium]